MSDVPPEIIKDILSRLPMKSLLRFRCVSKSWRSFIDSNDFIKLHLHRSSKANSNRTLLVDSTQLFHIDLDSFERLDSGNTRFDPYSVVNSCNGLVLVVPSFDNVVLWNPCTRKLNRLPVDSVSWHTTSDYPQERFALGYDSKHDDYKVVKVVQGICEEDNDERLLTDTKIFSLETNSWKTVDDFPIPFLLPYGKRMGVYLNDAIHTLVENHSDSEVIMAFDLAKERQFELPMPKFSLMDCGFVSVEVMGGCLAVVVPWKNSTIDVWLMKEYGVEESWTKLLCFKPPIPETVVLSPLAYSKSGDEVLLNYNGMCLNWYDLRSKSVTIACVSGLSASFNSTPLDHPFHAEVCVGSLVSPYSPAAVGAEKQNCRQGKKGREIKKRRDDFLSVGFKLKL